MTEPEPEPDLKPDAGVGDSRIARALDAQKEEAEQTPPGSSRAEPSSSSAGGESSARAPTAERASTPTPTKTPSAAPDADAAAEEAEEEVHVVSSTLLSLSPSYPYESYVRQIICEQISCASTGIACVIQLCTLASNLLFYFRFHIISRRISQGSWISIVV